MFLWFHRLSTAKYFFDFASRLFPWLATLAAITIAVGLYLGLLVAPADYQQGEGYRIMFVHVPSAWMSMFIYVFMAVSGAIGLIWRIKARASCLYRSRYDWGFFHIDDSGNRLNLGEAHVGCLVGLGCKIDVGTDSAVSIPRIHRTTDRNSRSKQSSTGWCDSAACWCSQHPHHSLLGTLVAYASSKRLGIEIRNAVNSSKHARTSAAHGRWIHVALLHDSDNSSQGAHS